MWYWYDPLHLFCFVILGTVAAWLAGRALPGRGLGWAGNVFGAVVGGIFFRLVGWLLFGSLLGSLFTAFIGAVLFLAVINLFKRR